MNAFALLKFMLWIRPIAACILPADPSPNSHNALPVPGSGIEKSKIQKLKRMIDAGTPSEILTH